MKKIFMAAVALLCFAVALTLTQISCSKSTAQTTSSSTPTPIGLVLFEGSSESTPYDLTTFYVCNYDGTNAHQIVIQNLPSGYVIQPGGKLSPDGKTLFFAAGNPAQTLPGNLYQCYLYSTSTSGTNLTQIATISTNACYGPSVDGAY
jgi:hypothetical protein